MAQAQDIDRFRAQGFAVDAGDARQGNVGVGGSPEEMEQALVSSRSVAVIEKKYLKTSMRRTAFSVMIQSILQHFAGVVSGPILSALTQVIENYACICMMKQDSASYKNVCFKFFARSQHSNEVLVLLLNIHYEEASWKYKMLNFFRFRRELMHLNFLGALVRTDLQPPRRLAA
jgi:hypothetical protein